MARLPSTNDSQAPPPSTPLSPSPKQAAERFARLLRRLDILLVPIVLALGFLLASFAVRNADFWLHIATGRHIAQGHVDVLLGTDPFSFATKGRHWVNHAWLFDVILYALYSIGTSGAAVVIFKALLVSGIAAVMFLACRPRPEEAIRPGSKADPTRWFAAVAIALALMAAAPRLLPQPLLVSLLFVAVTFWMLNSWRDHTSVWRLPASLAVLFAVWVNMDAWFILGPLMVALFLLGEVLQKLLPAAAPATYQPARTRILGLALVVGLAACLLNPHHVWAFQLPPEFANLQLDPVFRSEANVKPQFYSVWEQKYYSDPALGYSIPGLCYALLFGLGLLSIVLNITAVRWSLTLTWIAFAALSLARYRAIPLFAVVSALIAVQMVQAFFVRRPERGYVDADSELRPGASGGGVTVTASGLAAFVGLLGRLFTLVAGLLLLVAAYPGWLHALTPVSANRHANWIVDPNPSLKELAEQIQHWHDDGRLSSGAHGFHFQPETSFYCAWFAPSEKVLFDTRFHLMGDLAEDYMRVRRGLRETAENKTATDDWAATLRRHTIGHIVLANVGGKENGRLITWFLLDDQQWSLWYQNGYAAVFGWNEPGQLAKPDPLRLDLGAMAFGKKAMHLPRPKPEALALTADSEGDEPPKQDDLHKYLNPPRISSYDADATRLFFVMRLGALEKTSRECSLAFSAAQIAAEVTLPATGSQAILAFFPMRGHPALREQVVTLMIRGQELPNALGLLGVRAGWQAVLKHPDDAYPYMLLSLAYDAWEQLGSELREMQLLTILHQGIGRLTLEDRESKTVESLVTDSYLRLFSLHARKQHLDLAEEALAQALKTYRKSPPTNTRDDEVEAMEKRLKQTLDELRKTVQSRRNQFLVGSEKKSVYEQTSMAMQYGLVREALRVLTDHIADLDLAGLELLVTLYLTVGQVGNAQFVLDKTSEDLPEPSKTAFGRLRINAAIAAGNFSRAATALDSMRAAFEQARDAGRLNFDLGVALGGLFVSDMIMGNPLPQICGLELVIEPRLLAPAVAREQRWIGASYRLHDMARQLAEFHAMRGMLALEEGDNATALQHLQQAVAPSVGPAVHFTGRPTAARYLGFLKRHMTP